MILRKSDHTVKSQRGFTLIEVLVVLAILGLIAGGISTATIQILKQSTRNGNFTTASQFTVSAVHWISRDAEMSQTVSTSGEFGFPLSLSWIDWGNVGYQVVYTLADDQLKRSYSVNGGESTDTIVAQYIDTTSGNTTCEYGSRVLILKVTATVGQGARAVSVTNKREIFMRSVP